MFDCEWHGKPFEAESKLAPFVGRADFGPGNAPDGVSGAGGYPELPGKRMEAQAITGAALAWAMVSRCKGTARSAPDREVEGSSPSETANRAPSPTAEAIGSSPVKSLFESEDAHQIWTSGPRGEGCRLLI